MKNIKELIIMLFFMFSADAQIAVMPAGAGDSISPYQIDSFPNLYWLSTDTSVWAKGKYFVQNADIDASVTSSLPNGFSSIGDSLNNFIGHYNGKGHNISYLFIYYAKKYNGLFGILNGYIDSLDILSCNLTSKNTNIGIVAGYVKSGIISNCCVTGCMAGLMSNSAGGIAGYVKSGTIKNCNTKISIESYTLCKAGGIAGIVSSNATIINCSSTGNVDGLFDIGGLVGNNSGKIISCYTFCNVTGSSDVGGITGNNTGTIKNCHTDGFVGGGEFAGGITGNNYDTIDNCYATGSIHTGSSYAGGLVGYNYQKSVITNSFAIGTVTAKEGGIGGLVGHTDSFSTILNCYARGNVHSKSGGDIGGLVGSCYYAGNICNCYATGNLYIDTSVVCDNTGGLIGYSFKSNLFNCYATGNVYGSKFNGGFIGYAVNDIIVKNCYSTGNVYGSDSYVGGFVGYAKQENIVDCYSTGKNSCDSIYLGGFAGINISGVFSNCFSTGHIVGEAKLKGGFTGKNDSGYIYNCYWDINASKSDSGAGQNSGTMSITGLTSVQMKDASNFVGFSFDTVWAIRKDSTYPYLRNVANNAPFAFGDSITTGRTLSLSRLLLNDYDPETMQAKLVLKINQLTSGATDSVSTLTFPDNITDGSYAYLTYRIGEIRDSLHDTLWGNIATSEIIIDLGHPADISKSSKITGKYGFNISSLNETAQYELPAAEYVSMKIFSLKGQLISEPVNSFQSPGKHFVDLRNNGLPPGGYVVMFCAGSYKKTTVTKLTR
jgi:hypothetical protein